MHGRDKIVANQFVHMAGAKKHLGPESLFHVVHRGAADCRIIRNRVNQGVFAILRKLLAQFVELGLAKAGTIDYCGDNIQGIWLQAFHYKLQGIRNIPGRRVLSAGNQHYRAAQIGRNFRIQLEFENRVLAQKISAYAQHEIVGLEQFFVFLDYVFDKQVAGSLVDNVAGFRLRVGKGIGIFHIQLEMGDQQIDIGITGIKLGFVDDGTKYGNAAHGARKHLHDAKRDRAFAGHGPRSCNIERILFHLYPPAQRRGQMAAPRVSFSQIAYASSLPGHVPGKGRSLSCL